MSRALIHGTRALKPPERRYLLEQVGFAAGAIAVLLGGLLALAAWSLWQRDRGAMGLLALIAVPAALGVRALWTWATPFRRDLVDDRAESIVGKVGALELQPGPVPIYLGDRVFVLPGDLLAGKQVDQPILFEFLPHSGLALTVDGKPNPLFTA